jgi:3alpha(or 20beta)-hydroxysteroid dehydrogenase
MATEVRLEGKVALITGAGQGIGEAIARRFAQEGARVLMTDFNEQAVLKLAEELGAQGRVHDVSSEAAWEEVAIWAMTSERQIDVLVNNAGVFFSGRINDTPLEEFRRVQDANVVGVFLGMRIVTPLMTERKSGSIINLSSLAGRMGSPYLTAYAASKWAVRGMTKCLAKELASTGVRVNSLQPGQIDTEMLRAQRERTPELVEKMIKGIPMGRVGEAVEIAEAAVFLASDESRYVTGTEIVIDGGVSA